MLEASDLTPHPGPTLGRVLDADAGKGPAGGALRDVVLLTHPRSLAEPEVVAAARRVSAVRWNVASSIVYAWVITIPASGIVAALTYWAVVLLR